MASNSMVSSLSPSFVKARSCLEKQRLLKRAQQNIRTLTMKTSSRAIVALDWQSPSPAAHRGSTGHAAPVPLGAAVCVHSLRQSLEHADHSPAQSCGQSSSPVAHRGSTGHAAPVPLGAAVCVHSLRQSLEHADHSPAQSIVGSRSSVQLR